MSAEHDKEAQSLLDAHQAEISQLIDGLNTLYEGHDIRAVVAASEVGFAATLSQFICTMAETNQERQELLEQVMGNFIGNIAPHIFDEPQIAQPQSDIILKA